MSLDYSTLSYIMQDDLAAVEFLEKQRWGDRPKCVHCGAISVYKMKSKDGMRNARFLWVCKDCGKQYTVRIGTELEESRIPMRHWVCAMWAVQEGIPVLRLHKHTGISYKSCLYLVNRVKMGLSTS